MNQIHRHAMSRLLTFGVFACLLSLPADSPALATERAPTTAEASTSTFDLECTTTADLVRGTLADGSPVMASAIGEVRRYAFDLDARRFASNGRITAIHRIDGNTVIKADPNEIRSFGGVVHMQSEWQLDLESGISIRKNRFYRDGTGSEETGGSEWHQQCKRAPYSGMPAG